MQSEGGEIESSVDVYERTSCECETRGDGATTRVFTLNDAVVFCLFV